MGKRKAKDRTTQKPRPAKRVNRKIKKHTKPQLTNIATDKLITEHHARLVTPPAIAAYNANPPKNSLQR
jgi:hypothetical protein